MKEAGYSDSSPVPTNIKQNLNDSNPSIQFEQISGTMPEFGPDDCYSLSEQDIEQLKKDGYTIIEY